MKKERIILDPLTTYNLILETSLWGQNELIIEKMTEKKKWKKKKNYFRSVNNL